LLVGFLPFLDALLGAGTETLLRPLVPFTFVTEAFFPETRFALDFRAEVRFGIFFAS
jgi:hypothetical protein